MRNNFLARFWPLIFILVVWLVFTLPYFVKDRTIFPSDYQAADFAPWDAYQNLSGPVKNAAMPDIIDQIYPWKHLVISEWKKGIIPLWNPYSFSGTPLMANYQSAVFSPFNLLFFIFNFISAWNILVLIQPLLAGVFMYIFMRSLKIKPYAGVLSSLAFMFCGFMTVWMAYATLDYAILFLPLALFAIEKYQESNKPGFLLVLGISIPLSFFSGHFQINIYFLATVVGYLIYKFIVNKKTVLFISCLLSVFFGMLLSMVQILPSIQFYLQSLRSNLFAQLEVIPFGYLPTFIAPDFLGNPVTRNAWFGHYAEWNAYIGVLPLMLCFYSLKKINHGQKAFFIIVAIISFLLAFNTPVLYLMIHLHMPVLSTSAASRIIVLFSFSMAVLAGMGFQRLIQDLKDKKIRRVIVWLGIFLAVFAVLWLIVVLKLFLPNSAIAIAKSNLKLPSAIFIASAVLISFYLFVFPKDKTLFSKILILLLLILVSFDMLRFTLKWQPFAPKNLAYKSLPTTSEFINLSSYNRFFANFGAESSVYYGLPSVEGYDALYIQRYGEFVASLADGKISESGRSVVSFPKEGINSVKAVDFLGIKYIIHKIADDHASWTLPFWSYPGMNLVYQDDYYNIYNNTKAFPRAFLVGNYKVETRGQKIINTMFGSGFNLRNEVVLEQNPEFKKSKSSSVGEAKILSYLPDRVTISVTARRKSILVLTDNYYPGWRASVNGKLSKIYRADYTFRAIVIPSGKSAVVFYYDPLSFRFGVLLSIFGAVGILLLCFFIRRRKI